MKSEICPFLGLENDPTTSLEFPSKGNFCHGAKGARKVPLKYQSLYCLQGDHIRCQIYQQHKDPEPAALVAGGAVAAQQVKSPFYHQKWFWIAVLILFLFPTGVGLASTFIPTDRLLTFFQPDRSNRGVGTGDNTSAFNLLTGGGITTSTPFRPMISGTPVVGSCPPPQGWIAYVVQPTDSIYRLSEVYSIPLEELQKANCMGSATLIKPGQLLFVPFTPTPSAMATDISDLLSIPLTGFTSTKTPSSGNVVSPPNQPATNTPRPTDTPFIPTATNTPVPSPTPIPPPTNTAVPTATNRPTAIIPPTFTPIPPTPTPTQTRRPTHTPKPTKTQAPAATDPPFIFPTNTPVTIFLPTDTPFVATDTQAPAPTNPPLPTDTPVPPAPAPTNPPLPTDTPVPPAPTPVLIDPTLPPLFQFFTLLFPM